MKDISGIFLTATVGEDFEQRTSRNNRTYYTGSLLFLPERAEEPVTLRAFAFSDFPFKDGMPTAGDRVAVTGSISPERDGGLGVRVDSVQVIGQGELPEGETVEDDISF